MPRYSIVTILLALCTTSCASPPADTREAVRIGHGVLAIQAALEQPESPQSMQAVLDLGRDSRHYVMVRGWLGLALEGDRSIASAAGEDVPAPVRRRIEFLEAALRALDLE